MAHIIEVIRNSAAEACSFLDALFYSDSVSAIGFRQKDEIFIAVAVNWEADEETGLDVRISSLITDSLELGYDLDEISTYCRIYPKTILYQPEFSDN